MICLFPVDYIAFMQKMSIHVVVPLLVRIPGVFFARISIDKIALYVSAPSDLHLKKSSNFSLTAQLQRNDTGIRKDGNSTSQVWNVAPPEHAKVPDVHRSKLHAMRSKSDQEHPLLISQSDLKTVSSRHAESPPKTFSTLSELLSTVENPKGPTYVRTPKKTTWADVQSNFFQAAGLVPGVPCKRSGFFAGHGCSLGCTCAWYEYCSKNKREHLESINVGMCTTSTFAPLLLMLLLCFSNICLCMICLSKDLHPLEGGVLESREGTPRIHRQSTDRRGSARAAFADLMRTLGPANRLKRSTSSLSGTNRTPSLASSDDFDVN